MWQLHGSYCFALKQIGTGFTIPVDRSGHFKYESMLAHAQANHPFPAFVS